MKFSDKIAQHAGEHPFFTFEFFPPKTDLVRVCSNLSVACDFNMKIDRALRIYSLE